MAEETGKAAKLDMWQRHWLDQKGGDLESSIQHVATDMVEYLVQKGTMDNDKGTAYQKVISSETVPIEKAHALLDWLSKQPPSTFWTFQAALREYLPVSKAKALVLGDGDVRELLERTSKLPMAEKLALLSGRAVTAARQALREHYGKYGDQPLVVVRSGKGRGEGPSLDELFVNISLLSSEALERMAKEEHSFGSNKDGERLEFLFQRVLQRTGSGALLGLKDVFVAREEEGGDDPASRVLATGGAGCGKTTCFTRKAPYSWAIGELWPEIVLLFCLHFRDQRVWKAENVTQLLRLSSLELSPADQKEVMAFIHDHPEHVLIICDGLDEGKVDKNSLLWQMLERQCPSLPSNL